MSTAEHYLVHIEYVKKHVTDVKILASSPEKAREKALKIITSAEGKPLENHYHKGR